MKSLKNRVINSAPNTSLIDIDFSKPWWNIFTQQKKDIAIVLTATIISNILITLFPKLISWAIDTENLYNLAIAISIYLADEVSNWFLLGPYSISLYIRTVESFRCSAYQTLLTIDPIYHAQQSSGVGIGKIRRTMEAYKDITKTLLDDFIPLFISLITMVLLFLYFDVLLAIIASAGLLILSTIRTTGLIGLFNITCNFNAIFRSDVVI